MDRALHPNLARVAAAYDEILVEFNRGVIPPQEARRRVLALVARDDNGLEWSIDPESGQWRYRTHWGDLILADPPAYGVVGLTPHALGAGNARDADERLNFYEVDQTALYAPGSLRGSTMLRPEPARGSRNMNRLVAGAVLAASAAAAAAATLLMFRLL
jgi:hypothetical protein